MFVAKRSTGAERAAGTAAGTAGKCVLHEGITLTVSLLKAVQTSIQKATKVLQLQQCEQVSNCVETSFKSSVESLECLLDEFFCDKIYRLICSTVSWYINSMKCRPNPDPNPNPNAESFSSSRKSSTRNSTRNSTRVICSLVNRHQLMNLFLHVT